MSYLLKTLSNHKLLCLSIALCYFIAVVLPHDFVGAQIYARLFHGSIPDYNRTFLLIVGTGLVLVLPAIIQKLRRSNALHLYLFCIGSLILLMIGSYFSIMVLATETIHWIQYAVMAILLYPLVRHIGDTLIWTTLLGAMDEGWQYFKLGSSDYFDFNDVILNFQGAALGLWLVTLFTQSTLRKEKFPVFTPAALTFMMIMIIGVLASLSGIMLLYGTPENSGVLTLSPLKPYTFWSAFHQYPYHILRPWEAIVLLVVLYHFYRWMFGRIMQANTSKFQEEVRAPISSRS